MKNKIFLISRPFLGYTSGTGEQYVTNTLYATLIKKYHVDIVTTFLWIPPYHSIWSCIFYDYINPLVILFLCKSRDIHFVLFCSPFQSFFIRLFRIFHIETMIIVHDCFFLHYECKSIFDKYSLFLYKQSIQYSDHVITSTVENQLQIKKFFLRKPDIIPLFLDSTFTIDFISKEYTSTFGYIGKYDNFRKRTFYLLEYIKQTQHKIVFSFAWHITEEYMKNLELIENNNVIINKIGPISMWEKINFYRNINFLFFPTDLEGFGLPILEALRTSTIPIVFEDAQIPDVLKKMCIQINSVNEIDSIIDNFTKNILSYSHTIYKNYEYSIQFTENNLLSLLDNYTKSMNNI